MTRDEIMDLEAKEIAALLNAEIEKGADKAGALEALGLAQADIMKAQVFFVKGKFMARAWAGYTSTKRTGNEAGDSANGVGGSDPSKGFAGI
ncbi:MAG: hypothetical protein PUD96_01705 [Coriobacteriaceae bacterium]|nr:hypothetical protein [Coriobacteriaceae bacterium]